MKPSAEVLEARRERVARRWELTDEVVLLRAGEPASWPGTDQFFAFLPHPDVAYLSAVGSPGTTLAYDAAAEAWELFGPRFTPERLVWEQPPVEVGLPLAELDGWLAQRSDRTIIELGAGAEMAETAPAGPDAVPESAEVSAAVSDGGTESDSASDSDVASEPGDSAVGSDPGGSDPGGSEPGGSDPGDHPAGNEPADKPADKPAEHPAADKPADKPGDHPAGNEPADKPADKPVDEPADKPVDEPADKPADKPAEHPAANKPADEPADQPTDETPAARTLRLSAGLALERMVKDAAEVDDIRTAAAASAAGFGWVYQHAAPGMSEREIQIGMEAQFYAAGAPRVAYDSIVASGPHGAYLHYVYAGDDPLRPATRTVEPGDLLLIDAGAQYGGYASDVTRTMVVGAEPTDEQAFLWNLVLSAQQQTIDMCRPGIQWRDVHLAAARILAAGLVEMDLMRGEAAELVTSGAVALFFPHGLGHLLGLSVHDASGFPPGHERSSDPQLRYLRTDRGLEPGMVTTVEPGIYFIDALLCDPARREKFAGSVVWERVDELRGFGGIRIEDDVLVTDGGPEVLTSAIPKPMRIG